MSRDYHDYVFKDGKLVGDFDNMYRNSGEVPWHQDTASEQWFTDIGLIMLRAQAPYRSILEIGCGLGYIARKLVEYSDRPVAAMDISHQAVNEARTIHAQSNIKFFQADIQDRDLVIDNRYQLIVMKDVLWYVLEKVDIVLENLTRYLQPGGFIYINQSFPALDGPFVGKDIFPNPDALEKYLLAKFKPLYKMTLKRCEIENEGPWYHFFGALK